MPCWAGARGAGRFILYTLCWQALEEQAAEAEALAGWLPELASCLLRRLLAALEHQERIPKKNDGQRVLLMQWRMTAIARGIGCGAVL